MRDEIEKKPFIKTGVENSEYISINTGNSLEENVSINTNINNTENTYITTENTKETKTYFSTGNVVDPKKYMTTGSDPTTTDIPNPLRSSSSQSSSSMSSSSSVSSSSRSSSSSMSSSSISSSSSSSQSSSSATCNDPAICAAPVQPVAKSTTGASGTDCDDKITSDSITYDGYSSGVGLRRWSWVKVHETGLLRLFITYCEGTETWWAVIEWNTGGGGPEVEYGGDTIIDCALNRGTNVTGDVCCVNGIITTFPTITLPGNNRAYNCTGKTVTITLGN